MNRHTRRAELRSFKRDAHRTDLVTYLIAADDASLDRKPLLARALSFWRGQIQRRRPYCPNCKANFADDAHPGAFLFSTIAVAPTSATVTAFCDQCWHDLSPAVIERQAARVLRQILPGGRFLDQQDASP